MLIKEIEALLVNKMSLPAFGLKCIKFKEMFPNPPGIPFQAYFSEINKMFYPEPSKPFTSSSWSWDWPILWPNVMAFNGNMGSWAVKPSRGRLPSTWMSSTAAQLNWILLFTSSTRISVQWEWAICSDGSWQSSHTLATPPIKRRNWFPQLKSASQAVWEEGPHHTCFWSPWHHAAAPDDAQTGVYVQFPFYYSPNLHLLGEPLQGHHLQEYFSHCPNRAIQIGDVFWIWNNPAIQHGLFYGINEIECSGKCLLSEAGLSPTFRKLLA